MSTTREEWWRLPRPLTPATARGAFLTMQIEREREREALQRAKDSDTQDKLEKGATYLRLANARLRSGALIEPSEDNARFYLEAASQLLPDDDPGLAETRRGLQRALLDRASAAASDGNAAETERWLANADDAGAPRADIAAIRRALKDTEIGARAGKMTTLTLSFTNALAANRLLQPASDNAKAHLLAMINIDGSHPAVASARQSLGNALLGEFRGALARGDLTAADTWLNEARTIGFSGNELKTAEGDLAGAREKAAQRTAVVAGGKSLERIEYVAPKFPTATRNRASSGWVELEFTVLPDGSTGDIVVTNSNPRKTFDASAVTAVGQWRYKPLTARRQARRAARRRSHQIRGSIDGRASHTTIPDRRERRQVRAVVAAHRERRLAQRFHRHHGLDVVRPGAHRDDRAGLRHRDARAGLRRRHRGSDHRQLRLDPQAAQPARLSRDDHPRRRRQRAGRHPHAAARCGRLSTQAAADTAAPAALHQAHAARH